MAVTALSHAVAVPHTQRTAIALTQVALTYGRKAQLREIIAPLDLTVEEGSFVAILGPSGCGKTSLLRLIAGYLQPTEGSIELFGNAHTKPKPEIGVVFQHSNLFPWLSVKSNVSFGLKMAGIPKSIREQRALDALEQVRLSHAAKLLPHQLSGGMKQRAALARTLITEPSILLMDEPFAALDAITREALQLQLKEIWNEQKRTVFFITHDVDEALLLGTRIIVMGSSPGTIQQDIPNTVHDHAIAASHAKLREHLLASLR